MLRIIQNSSAGGAKSYYSTADYYTQELPGVWRGKAAAMLGLSGTVNQREWDALCDNRHPETGNTLTARQKANRRIGYDFNFHVPKSVSLLHALNGDERIIAAFREAVNETMNDIEAEAKTRVRASGRNEDRVSGNLVWGEFVHLTARPVSGIPDPHLHAHCFVFNTTWDDAEHRWKAAQFADLKRDAPFFEAKFHARLAGKMVDLGYGVERTRHGWEVAGVPTSALKRFSRRTALIEAKARAQGITDPARKDELGAKTREKKATDLTMPELQAEWRNRLEGPERSAIASIKTKPAARDRKAEAVAATRAVERALSHCFERSSVLPERTAQTEALKRAYGAASVEQTLSAFSKAKLLASERDGRAFVTTPAVLDEERRMLDFARNGRGTCAPFALGEHRFERDWLSDGQRRAAQHVLSSHDRVILIRGAAGVGKTAMMSEAVEGIEAGGRRVFAFAPSAEASRGVLRGEGFQNADTLARLLKDTALQDDARVQVIWVDEAGQVGSRDMARLFELVDRIDARLILSGDRRQHGSVDRGAALKLLEEEAGLKPAELTDIRRQHGSYKRAVKALSEGNIKEGFGELDALGWIREVSSDQRYKRLASDYVEAVRAGKTALVVSPTHLEGDWITSEIRSSLKADKLLGSDERIFTVLENANLTESERADPVNYFPGDVLIFHENAGPYRRGERVVVGEEAVPYAAARSFTAYHPRAMAVAPGEVIRVTRNGKSADDHRLNNGGIFTVQGFNRAGDIVLANGWTLSKDFGHIDYGYVSTSYASQGKTVDRVFIGQSAISRPASSAQQFYVSVSRAREQAVIYTDDKSELLEAVSGADERPTATEFERDRLRRAAVLNPNRPLPVAAMDAARNRGQERTRG
ncbi:MAG: relaxase domain-containing protein [Phycisphaerales bacterium]|nr:relaxase domain-containing protein [Phycisphaerales bacterium]